MKTPSCKTCHKLAVPANAGIFKSIPYFYCRNCKFEVNEWGFEVEYIPKAPDSLKELDDYLSGELGRFDNEAPPPKKKFKSVYDPFHKRNMKVEDEEPEEEDDSFLGDFIMDFETIP